MRVITGKYKGRHFDIPRTFKARPTTDFAKENIFNVLNGYIDFEDCRALDLFVGTGSISIELLSREAQYVVGLELDRDHCTFIRQCIDKLGADNYSLIPGDVFRYLKSCRETFDLIFADPPYVLKNLEEIPQIVLDKGILSEDGIFVLEHGKHNHFEEHPCFLERRAYGSVNFSLFKAKPKE